MTSPYMKMYIPVIHITCSLNPQRTLSFIENIQKISKMNIVAFALVVDVQDQLPVQVDKVLQALKKIKKENQTLPIYGFTQSQCTPQSYYLLSMCNQIYTSPTSIFTFQRQIKKFSLERFFEKWNLKKFALASQSNLLGRYIDAFSSPITMNYGNQKETDIAQRLYKYSLLNRNEVNPTIELPSSVEPKMLGKDVVQNGLADGYGYYERILRQKHPEINLFNVEYANQNLTVLKIVAIITSPFLILLFLFKVALKWSIILYVWLTQKKKKQKSEISDN